MKKEVNDSTLCFVSEEAKQRQGPSVVMVDSVLEENLVTCNGGLFSFHY